MANCRGELFALLKLRIKRANTQVIGVNLSKQLKIVELFLKPWKGVISVA